MESTIAQVILTLRCHSCSCRMGPPLFQCPWGHQYCSKCIELSSSCSKNHPPEQIRRNYIFERLWFSSPLKCSYSGNGCNVTGIASVVAEHEYFCSFSLKQCRPNEDENNEDMNQPSEPAVSKITANDNARKQLDVFLEVLECPVCIERVSLPINQCINGHQICNRCFRRMERCPVCRGLKSDSRNILLEVIFDSVEVPCNYADSGCTFCAKGSKISRHEESCTFIPKSCPLTMCIWRGLESELVDHCRKCHSNVISFESQSRCIWYITDNEAWFTVNCMGCERSENLYGYEITITANRGIVFRSGRVICSHLPDGTMDFVDSHFIVFSIPQLLELCDNESGLTYDVAIFDMNE